MEAQTLIIVADAVQPCVVKPAPLSLLHPYSWLSALEGTRWLQHLSLLLKAALLVVNAVDRDHRPVLVHCSDGWDRTPQIVALSKLLLDPYYRTVEVGRHGVGFGAERLDAFTAR